MKKIAIFILALCLAYSQMLTAYAMEEKPEESMSQIAEEGGKEKKQNAETLTTENTNKIFEIDENGTLLAYHGIDSNVEIPEGVVRIEDNVFKNNKTIQSVVFPDSLKYIGESAFSDSGLIGNLIFPEDLESIGMNSFINLELDYVYFPASVTWATSAFEGTTIDLLEFGEGRTQVQTGIFRNSGVKEIKFASSIQQINYFAFIGCKSLQKIHLSSQLKTIQKQAFYDCDSLTEVILPEGLTELEEEAFGECDNLTTITIPSTIQESGHTETIISSGPFRGCKNLKNLYFNENVQFIPELLFDGTGIEELILPDSITRIGKWAFQDCENLIYVYIPESVTEIGDDIFIGTYPIKIYCVENSYAHQYAQENNIEFDFGEHEHHYGDWEIQTYPTCTEDGLKKRYCTCGLFEEKVLPCLGHEYWDFWFTDKEPTCTEDGWHSHHCMRCEVKKDGEKIPKLGHSFGEWEIIKEATYFNEGKKERVCSRCQELQEETIPKLDPDFESHPDYSFASLQIVDAKTLAPVKGALVEISKDGKTFEASSNEEGLVKLFVPNGTYNFVITKENYINREFTYTLEIGNVELPQIGISDGTLVTGELTVTEMTKQDMVDAGIDFNDPDNEHVFKYKTTLKFSDGIEIYTIPSVIFKNQKGKEVGSYFGDSTNTGNVYIIDKTEPIRITRVSENLYIVVQGQTKWLKEMFHVQLVVVNTSLTDQLLDCEAKLNLPDGLSLADLSVKDQSNNVSIDTVDKGQSETIDWYICGDKTGDYNFSASLSGRFSLGDRFEYVFKTQDSLHVYAGTDMHLTVHCLDAAYYGKPYTMIFELENVSNHTIYDVRHQIKNVTQYQVKKYAWVDEDEVVHKEEVWNTLDTQDVGLDGIVLKDEFKPGEKLAVLVKTDIMWQSPLHRLKESSGALNTLLKFGGVSGNALSVLFSAISFIDVRYYLSDIMVSYAEDNSTQIPITFDIEHHQGTSLYDKVFQEALKKYFGKIENGTINLIGGEGASSYYSLFKSMGKHLVMQGIDSNTECLAWIEETDRNTNVLALSVDNAEKNEDGKFIVDSNSEITIEALDVGEADLVIQDQDGSVVKHHFKVYESFPGQEFIAPTADDLFTIDYLIVPLEEIVTKELLSFYEQLGCKLIYNGQILQEGDSIPTGSQIVDENGTEILNAIMPGDSNSDAKVNLFDGYQMLNLEKQRSAQTPQYAASNLNGDSVVDRKDTEYLFRFLTKENDKMDSQEEVNSIYQTTLTDYLQGIQNIQGIQIDVEKVSEYGIKNAKVICDVKGDFNQSVINQNLIRTIVANYDSELNLSNGNLQIQYDSIENELILPANMYIQTGNKEIVKEVNLKFTKKTYSPQNDFEDKVNQFEQDLSDYEQKFDNSDIQDCFKEELRELIQEYKERLDSVTSLEELDRLKFELIEKYQDIIKKANQSSNTSMNETSSEDKNESTIITDSKKQNTNTSSLVVNMTVYMWMLSISFSVLILLFTRKKKNSR